MNRNNTISRITVDVSAGKSFEYVKAVQNDIETRYVYITLLDNGIPYVFSGGDIVLRGTKPDGNVIFNYCSLNEENEIVVTLTPQMLSVAGRSVYEIAIYDLEADTSVLLTSFPFYLLVSETNYDGHIIESSHEFKALLDIMTHAVSINELGEKVIDASWNIKEIEKTIRDDSANAKKYADLSESWAVGGNGVRSDEGTNNSKYFSDLSKQSEQAAKTSEINAKVSETNAKEHLDKVTEITEAFSFTKADVGLGNVDNTPDAEKSVNYANSAGSVPWNGISDKPEVFPPSFHTHDYSSISNVPTFQLDDTTLYINF